MSVKFPEVTLYVDGQPFKTEKKNPEIIDDWPLHHTKGINTTVAVGACWQGNDMLLGAKVAIFTQNKIFPTVLYYTHYLNFSFI